MKDITRIYETYLSAYKSNCSFWKDGACSRKGGCECVSPAEVAALTRTLLPQSCFLKHLEDFSGDVPGEGSVLPPAIVKTARDSVIEYCWGKGPFAPDTNFNSIELLKRSVLSYRRREGHSLIIHGDSYHRTTRQETFQNRGMSHDVKVPVVKKKATGKTLLASIVLKEVIRQRLFPGHLGDSYEWISFPSLKSKVMERENASIIDYQTCDWLVVDRIQPIDRVSENMRGYQLERLDTVFVDRIENNLPTILVFQFDITKDLEADTLQEKLGLGVSMIAEKDTTFNICLSAQ